VSKVSLFSVLLVTEKIIVAIYVDTLIPLQMSQEFVEAYIVKKKLVIIILSSCISKNSYFIT